MNFKPRLVFTICALFALLLTISAYGQTPVVEYNKEWKQVEDLLKKELPKSALAIVKTIYQQAKKDKQDAQLIKALVYRSSIEGRTVENGNTTIISNLEKELSSTNEPARSILSGLLAEFYLAYYNGQRYQIFQRTNTDNFVKDDIATWTASDFHKKINSLFLESLKNPILLQQTRLDTYNPIIIKGNMRHLRPTLFDLLAFQALEYFKINEFDVVRPAYAFQIDDPAAFASAAEFVRHNFASQDSIALDHEVLSLYQQLIRFHLHDVSPDALLDADLSRLAFVDVKSVLQNNRELYLAALQRIVDQYKNIPAASQAWYLIAQQYNEDASSYEPFSDTTHRFDKIKAREICERILQEPDSSEGKINAHNLLIQMNQKDLKFHLEKVNVPGQAFRSLIQYKNFSEVYVRVIRADEKISEDLSYLDEKGWAKITNLSPLRSWQQSLPDTKDMQEHAAEIKIDPLTPGDYLMLVSTEKSFGPQSLLGVTLFYVSNISYVNYGPNYFVLNRETGAPMTQASVQLWNREYDNKLSRFVNRKTDSYKTDEKGYFKLKDKPDQLNAKNFLLDISYANERLFLNEEQQTFYYSSTNVKTENRTSVFLFTDRSIYRPGQAIFFKGIAITSEPNGKKNSIKSHFSTIIYLQNANDETIDSMSVTTNDYGSFSGKFQLPTSGLNGSFTLTMKDDQGSSSISVEEYKRPKFFVDYEKIKASYKVNDTIRVTGFAKAYAGNNIDGATVKFHVARQPRFVYDWMFWKGWQPPIKEMQIAFGEIKTAADGKFEIKFAAIPDLSIDKRFDPVFDYRVYADVTDINGETRSASLTITAGYKSLLLNISVAEKVPLDSFKSISINTSNMAGEFQPARVSVAIYSLREENRLLRRRYWQRPDQFTMSKDEYIKAFPYDEYDNESDFRTWQRSAKVLEKTDSAKANGQLSLAGVNLKPGFYALEVITRDKDGQEVKDIGYTELYDEKASKLAHPSFLWTQGSKSIEPGEKTNIQIASSAKDVFLIQQVEKPAQIGASDAPIDYSFFNLNDEKKSFEFSATETDRGGYGVSYVFIKNNRVYQSSNSIRVPWDNKDLQIDYATFRDKILPGSEEKWKVRIKGYKNEMVAAEMLASMYDASLDQFQPHRLQIPDIWPYFQNYSDWSGDQDFLEIEAQERYLDESGYKELNKTYDVLLGYFSGRSRMDAFNPSTMARLSIGDPSKVIRETVVTGYGSVKNSMRVDKETTDTSAVSAFLNSAFIKSSLTPSPEPPINSIIQIRKNFNETAFFFPDLHTDSTGAIEFSFTVPEALTKWKMQTFAHTKELAFGMATKEIMTQKELMVQPNAPRFLREGDRMEFSAKIVNLTDSEFTGQAQLQLIDATTDQSIDGWFQNMSPNQYFTVAARQSELVKFPIQVPYLFNKALVWRIVARAGDFSDGEENAMAVLTNKTLVTETMPLNMRGAGTKNFKFDKLLKAGESETLQHYGLTVEYTSNPAWYAVQALPYLAEFPYECAEQTWNRYYANGLAGLIANSSPKLRQIFEQWKTKDTAALLSNLQKNEELKTALLEETPWVLEAKTEEQQKKNIALLFDMVKMSSALSGTLEKLSQMQSEGGGFPWFQGGPDDRYITQYIVTGIGHLKKLAHSIDEGSSQNLGEKLNDILAAALPYLDKKIQEDYANLLKHKTDLKKYSPGYTEVQYLYMRSFFPEFTMDKKTQAAYNYFRKQSQLFWTGQSKYMEGMIALSLWRTGDSRTPVQILRSLKETAITNPELGTYWNTESGWYWYQAPIETQSLLIEAFQEIAKDGKTVDDLKTWLLKNKQTNDWKTTKATAEACYALLLQGSQWLTNEPVVEIKLGNLSFSNAASEAGTGYFKNTVEGDKINSDLGNISVKVKSSNDSQENRLSSWGSVYWQYFENLDKIETSTTTPLKLSKKLFVEKNTDRGAVLTPINENDEVHVGDKIKVRVEVRVDRDMEYVHMKDMRASCLEPVDVLSEYKYQEGVGYYQSTKDASTNFFFSYLSKGTYVFEYPVFVTHAGNFSNGITTIQCMYAPEFISHSEGIRLTVVE